MAPNPFETPFESSFNTFTQFTKNCPRNILPVHVFNLSCNCFKFKPIFIFVSFDNVSMWIKFKIEGCCGRDHIVVGFIITYTISSYHH